MHIYFLFMCLLQLVATFKEETSCGCNNIDRTEREKSKSFPGESDKTEQCFVTNKFCNSKNDQCDDSDRMVLVPDGEYQIGTDEIIIKNDNEGPKRILKVKRFYIDKYEVSNKDFALFEAQTKYKTEAEFYGDSFVFGLFLNSTFKEQLKDFRVLQATWWYKVLGANWRYPFGPDSSITDNLDHPVVHVSWRDAQAFCKWRGARLPTEVEWEAACRGGHRDIKYPWGDKLFPGKKHMANIWQGTFPHHNSAKDGFIGTNPVHLYPPNDFGLYNMAGNVWEWTGDPWSKDKPSEKVKKGGSYLCHHSYCYRYRCSARSHNTEDSSAGNLGFRCAKSIN